MKSINLKACEVMDKLTEGLNGIGAHKKINNSNGAFMAVSVEIIDNVPSTGNGNMISVAHYYEQNGDLMRDPEMIFWVGKDHTGQTGYYPVYFLQDNVGVEQYSAIFENGKYVGIREKMQKDHASFANLWMKNIKAQQGL
jgi:hypothetical protein